MFVINRIYTLIIERRIRSKKREINNTAMLTMAVTVLIITFSASTLAYMVCCLQFSPLLSLSSSIPFKNPHVPFTTLSMSPSTTTCYWLDVHLSIIALSIDDRMISLLRAVCLPPLSMSIHDPYSRVKHMSFYRDVEEMPSDSGESSPSQVCNYKYADSNITSLPAASCCHHLPPADTCCMSAIFAIVCFYKSFTTSRRYKSNPRALITLLA